MGPSYGDFMPQETYELDQFNWIKTYEKLKEAIKRGTVTGDIGGSNFLHKGSYVASHQGQWR